MNFFLRILIFTYATTPSWFKLFEVAVAVIIDIFFKVLDLQFIDMPEEGI